ncbi:MAG TPA: Gfo/Idh/MocA family oxidoreductase [Phycisphaerales bacterium]|nr:Gfo/Idh/MocA family oxidoreductase [Phycisphaerales bacterium]
MCNIAVVGCGYWGPNLVRNLNSLADCNLKTVCDTDSDRLSHMKGLYPAVETTSDFDDLVKDREIDAIAVATPVRFHYEMARKSLLAGKHTFIEKPMARSSKECEELIALAEERGLVLMVGHTFVYSGPVRKIKEIVSSGELGELQYVSARRLNLGLLQKDINVAWDLAPHDISIILYVLGKDPVSVNCQGKSHVAKGVEDVTNMTLNFANGAFGIIQSSWLDPNKIRETVFIGTKKMLVYNDVEPTEKIKIYDKRVEIPPHYDSFGEFQYSYHYGGMYCPYIKLVEPLKVECQHFLDCVRTGAKSESSGADGLDVVRILEAASASLKIGGGQVVINQYPKITARAV